MRSPPGAPGTKGGSTHGDQRIMFRMDPGPQGSDL